MIVTDVIKLHNTDREVSWPSGALKSIRMLVKSDGMGFAMTRTTVYPTKSYQMWHYKKHLEACYCISGQGTLKDAQGRKYDIRPGIMYALDKHDKHWFRAKTRVILICVFNPPLNGLETHLEDGSYE